MVPDQQRLSIEERYGSRTRYQGLVTDAATNLAREGYVLNEDIPAIVEIALTNWDELTRGAAFAGK